MAVVAAAVFAAGPAAQVKPGHETFSVPEGGVNLPPGYTHTTKEQIEDRVRTFHIRN